MIDYSPLRSSHEIVFKGFDTTRRALGKRLDSAVRTVAHVADDLMSRCRALCKETIADALHLTSY